MRRGVGRRGPGLVGTMARTAVVAGTATAVVGGVSRHQQGKADQAADAAAYQQMQQQAEIAAQIQAAQAQSATAAAGAAPAGGDITSQLKQLADLKAAGVLSDEEFAAAKAKLLGA
jgi:putative oligomerization/nucleic acid binding protein